MFNYFKTILKMQVNFIFLQFHSYILVIKMVGVPGLEPGTSSLSGTRSNHLSYKPNGGMINSSMAYQPATIWIVVNNVAMNGMP